MIYPSTPLLDAVWSELEALLSPWPHGPAFLATMQDRRYFSSEDAAPLLYLPIWLWGEEDPTLQPLLVATACGYWYIRIQDDVLDEPATRGKHDWLLLGNCLIWAAQERYTAFCADPWFLTRAQAAWVRFSAATAHERRLLLRPGPFSAADFVASLDKFAFAEIPLLAVLARRQRFDDAAGVHALIHHLGAAYGRVNDVLGVWRDRAAGLNTYLIATARASLADPSDEAALERALVRGPFLHDTLSAAIADQQAAAPIAAALGMAPFAAYTAARVRRLQQLQQQLARLQLQSIFGIH